MICDNAIKGISIKTRGNMISDAREKLHYISGKKISSKTSIKTPEACAGLFRDMIHLTIRYNSLRTRVWKSTSRSSKSTKKKTSYHSVK